MKTIEQIEKKIRRIKPRFDQLNAPNEKKLTPGLEHELYELSGMLGILRWIKQK